VGGWAVRPAGAVGAAAVNPSCVQLAGRIARARAPALASAAVPLPCMQCRPLQRRFAACCWARTEGCSAVHHGLTSQQAGTMCRLLFSSLLRQLASVGYQQPATFPLAPPLLLPHFAMAARHCCHLYLYSHHCFPASNSSQAQPLPPNLSDCSLFATLIVVPICTVPIIDCPSRPAHALVAASASCKVGPPPHCSRTGGLPQWVGTRGHGQATLHL